MSSAVIICGNCLQGNVTGQGLDIFEEDYATISLRQAPLLTKKNDRRKNYLLITTTLA